MSVRVLVRGRIKEIHLCVCIVTSSTTHADICLGCIENSQRQFSCQTCVCSSSAFVSPISSLVSFSNVNTVPNVPLKFMAFKKTICVSVCTHVRTHTCMCAHLLHLCDSLCDFIAHKCGGAESALRRPHNAQSFFQFAGQVGLSGA